MKERICSVKNTMKAFSSMMLCLLAVILLCSGVMLTEAASTQEKRIYGDCNRDNSVDPKDALDVLKFTVKIKNMRKTDQKYADVNADGAVNADDAVQILEYTVKLRDSFLAAELGEPTPEPTLTPVDMEEINAGLHESDIKNLWICGDSISAKHDAKKDGMQGWGEFMVGYLNTTTQIHNNAKGGASSSSYYNLYQYELTFDNLEAGDLVIIQFGHNDAPASEKYTDPYAGSDVEGSYKHWLLNAYILPAIEAGAKPILATSMANSSFNSDGTVADPDYAAHITAMLELYDECIANGLEVYLLDSYKITSEHYNEIGQTATKALHIGQNHYNEAGACYAAGVICKELSETLGFFDPQDIRSAEMAERIYFTLNAE